MLDLTPTAKRRITATLKRMGKKNAETYNVSFKAGLRMELNKLMREYPETATAYALS